MIVVVGVLSFRVQAITTLLVGQEKNNFFRFFFLAWMIGWCIVRAMTKQNESLRWEPQSIPYQSLLEVHHRLMSIPEADRDAILAKPPGADRKADARWRRLCAKYNVATKAAGKSRDRKRYMREYALERRVKELEGELASVRNMVRENGPYWNTDALRRVINRVGSSVVDDGGVRQWFAVHMCGDCLRRIYKRIDANPFSICDRCRLRLQSMLEVVVKGSQ